MLKSGKIICPLFWIVILATDLILSAPVQVCVEESKHKTVDSNSLSPMSEVPTEDQRQCIVLCLKDRKSPCKSCIFSKSSCRLYSTTAKEAGVGLVSDSNSMYYEILEDCPPNKSPVSTAGEAKRRDLSLTEENNSAHQLAVKDMSSVSGAEGPPIQGPKARQEVVGGGGQYPSPGGGQYGPAPVPAPAPYQGPAPVPVTYAPAPVPAPVPAPAPATYGPWSAWTECPTIPCTYGAGGAGGAAAGGAAQTRARQCQGYGGCQGEPKQSQPCGCQQGQWTEWGPWASCSASCGGGQMSRSRTCTVPNTCQGQSTDQQQCGQGPCAQWSPWTGYGACSATCGSGTQNRQRTCAGYGGVGSGSGCSGPPTESMPCPSLPTCCSEWTAWGQCSCSCGSGTQTRTRSCGGGYSGGSGGGGGGGGGSNTETQPCSGGPCANWGNWAPWSACSVTCNSGQRSRLRQCGIQTCNSDVVSPGTGCAGESQGSEPCDAGPCAQWAEWVAWSPCSQTCGSGQQSRSRQCTGGGNCVGEGQQTQNCESGPCPQWCPWQNWAQCPVSCGEGQQTRTRTCGIGANCASNASPYGAPAGGRVGVAAIEIATGCGGESSQAQSCSAGPCATWSEWVNWSQCSSSCGAGQITRTRQCLGGSGCPGEPQQSQGCQGPPCAAWCPWQEWTPCSTTCSAGQKTRTRICSADSTCSSGSSSKNCAGESNEAEQCNAGPCPAWSDWEPWATCSATCGEGQRTRVRQCASGTNCPGESRAVESCSPCAVCPQWDVWTPWGSCQTSERQQPGGSYGSGAATEGQTCGRGQQTRSRSCTGSCGTGAGGCVGETLQNQPCVQQCAEWSPWTYWSVCSSTCANGQQTRSRQCSGTGCPGPATDNQACQMPACVQVVQPQGSYYQPQYAGFYQQRGG